VQYKSELLNKEFGKNWFFAVTNRNLASDYMQFGDTCDKRYLIWKFSQIMKGDSMKSPEKSCVKGGVSSVKTSKKPSKSPRIIRPITARSPTGSLAFSKNNLTKYSKRLKK
jgi:hypothetical protein